MRKIIGLILIVCIIMTAVPVAYASGITVSDDLLPIRFLSEMFNFSVAWDEQKNLVTVTK